MNRLRLAPVAALALALLATAGRVVVPIAVQQTIDNGLSGPEPDLPLVRLACGLALLAVVGAASAVLLMRRWRGERVVGPIQVQPQSAAGGGMTVPEV